MSKSIPKFLPKLPGLLASLLLIFFSGFWAYWSVNEMYHEGWWGAWYNRLFYLAPLAAVLLPGLVTFRWPLVGGPLIMAVGIFALFFFSSDVSYIGLAIAVVGAAFLVDGLLKRRQPSAEPLPGVWNWFKRHWRSLLLVGVPLVISIGASAVMLPVVLTRQDDGDRSARLIESNNGVSLVWAPAGPGWNLKQSWGGYPSWSSLARYGLEPVGFKDDAQQTQNPATQEDMDRANLCLYLSADGLSLMDAPQNIWRMPTTAETVAALGRHGQNAACTWNGEFRTQVNCQTQPDKESPLWDPTVSVIYYWTADSYNEKQGYFVAYNGTVSASLKTGGNPRHGYRCVKEP